ncbi:GNAT family N-acetyltransferase [Timonella sp. A28]|uniref:GNAT family N-acetyltransferase n=1 Tax=Timonella sp. A28 TaxID=3442640 RepID=UPI003EBB4844
MTLPHGFSYTQLTEADKRALIDLDLWVFPSDIDIDKYMKRPLPVELSRTRVVTTEDRRFVACHASYEYQNFPVPGSSVACGGLTWVGVHPQYRRQGLLRSMITQHLQDCVDRGEVISTLFAAEPTIYGRFGYGLASYDLRCTIGRGAALRPLFNDDETADLTIRIETYSPDEHQQLIEEVHAQGGQNVGGTGLNRPGWALRETPGLISYMHSDVDLSTGNEQQRIVIVERSGKPVGFARFRRKTNWENTGPSGAVNAGEVVALDPAASRKLWSVITDFDLTSTVTAFMIPVDDPIVGLLENNRAISMNHVDNVWTRIIDLHKALAQRQYAADVDVVLEVTDPLLPQNNGRWRVSAPAFGGADGTEQATVTATTDAADISLNVRELGAIYLGGVSLASLAASGQVTVHNQQAGIRASVAFGWPIAPMSSWVF